MGLWWGAGGGGGAAWTPVQLQYDVDVRVVVNRPGARAARRYERDLPLIDVTKARATDPTQKFGSKRNLGWASPFGYSSSDRLELW